MDLCVDGNIAQTFGPERATQYFARLLRVDLRSLRPTGSQEWPHAFFITSPAVKNSPPSVLIDRQPAWLLDYAIRDVGTVVPQHIWSVHHPSDGGRYYKNVPLNMPIFFVHNDRVTLGLPLLRAAAGDCMTLLGVGAAPPVGDCSTTSIRINWPGYGDWNTQITIKDQTPAHNTIPLEKFAKRVASAVCKFLDGAQRVHGNDPNWRVGNGGITKEHVILIGVVHVSQGSWQPILQLNCYVLSRSLHLPGLQ
ncbi:hypothetical protein BJV78DRAFT_1279317 [Lactifluus subvellereus]|nr:hypothetical protein BJV78DRAFT_1279317 [Lactifluus subvellereus]